jgi:hypothetical protein
MFVLLHISRKTWEATHYFEYILTLNTSGFSISDINVFTQPTYGYCSCEGSNFHASYVTSGLILLYVLLFLCHMFLFCKRFWDSKHVHCHLIYIR